MKILVCGGRNFNKRHFVFKCLDSFLKQNPSINCVVHGAATGADSLAGEWARSRNIEERRYPADWQKYGKRAGYLRNEEMLSKEKPDVIIAFPGGRGTDNMVQIAKESWMWTNNSIKIYKVRYENISKTDK